MIRFLIPLSLGLLLLTQTQGSRAESLVWVDESVNGNKVYIDQGSIRRQATVVWYWETLVRQMPDTEGAITIRMYRSADCRSDQVRIRQVIKFDRQKRLIRSNKYGDRGPVIEVKPNSLAYAALRFVCES